MLFEIFWLSLVAYICNLCLISHCFSCGMNNLLNLRFLTQFFSSWIDRLLDLGLMNQFFPSWNDNLFNLSLAYESLSCWGNNLLNQSLVSEVFFRFIQALLSTISSDLLQNRLNCHIFESEHLFLRYKRSNSCKKCNTLIFSQLRCIFIAIYCIYFLSFKILSTSKMLLILHNQ